MTEQSNLIQEQLVEKVDNEDPEYQRLLAAYTDNPFFDITKDAIRIYMESKEPAEPESNI